MQCLRGIVDLVDLVDLLPYYERAIGVQQNASLSLKAPLLATTENCMLSYDLQSVLTAQVTFEMHLEMDRRGK